MEKKHYDYAEGLNAPNWVQTIRGKNNQIIWWFASPIEISFFFVLIFALGFTFPLQLLVRALFSNSALIPWMAQGYVAWKVAKWYHNFEPEDKKTHMFFKDAWKYWKRFGKDKRALHHGERVEKDLREIQFERVVL